MASRQKSRGSRRAESGAAGREIIIPAGEFVMGSDDPHAYDNERPAHRVFVPAFALDAVRVTVGELSRVYGGGGYRRRGSVG